MLRLKDLRNSPNNNPTGKKLSQQALADVLQVSRSTVAMWETGASDPDTDSLQKIANYFGVSTDYLLGRDAPSVNSDTKKIPADLKKILENQQVMFDGEIITDKDRELINQMLTKMYQAGKDLNKRTKQSE
mgnify:CR=1 FL=1